MTKTDPHYPDFAALTPEAVQAMFAETLAAATRDIAAIVENPAAPDFANTVLALEHATQGLANMDGPEYLFVYHIGTPEYRAAGNDIATRRSQYTVELFQNRALYERLAAVPAPVDAVENALYTRLREKFMESGVHLPPGEQAEFTAIETRLTELKQLYSKNLTAAFATSPAIVDDTADMARGLPEDLVLAAREKAVELGLAGKLAVLPDRGNNFAVMNNAENRAMREAMFRTRATLARREDGPNNYPVIDETIRLRIRKAEIMGFETFADLQISQNRMARSVAEVRAVLDPILAVSHARAQDEVKILGAFARELDGLEKIEPWDLDYYARLYADRELGLDSREIKKYLPLGQVLDAMILHVKEFYGADLIARPDLPTFADGVTPYELRVDGALQGYIITDFFVRPGSKRDSAWAADYRVYQRDAGGREHLPVSLLSTNFQPPRGDTPLLLDPDQVTTAFHELGHALHLIFSRAPHTHISAFNAALDFIELPSTFNENYIFDAEVAPHYMRHYETGAPLDMATIEKLEASRSFMQGRFMLRQSMLNALDLGIHTLGVKDVLPTDWAEWERETVGRYDLLQTAPVKHLPIFNHIFASAYPAGYYAYIWSDILNADAYETFREHGIYDKRLTTIFRDEVLGAGASKPPSKLFAALTGRETPRPQPLMKKMGFTPA